MLVYTDDYYSSYLKGDENLTQSASYIVLMNIAVSVMVGLAIFPAIASFNMESVEGPGLVFIVLPEILKQFHLELFLSDVFSSLYLLH